MKGIFIGGMIKSGTSLVRRLVSSNDNVFSGLETYWFDLYDNFKHMNLVKGGGLTNQSCISDLQRLENLSRFYGISSVKVEEIYKNNSNALSFIENFFLECTQIHHKNPYVWLEKTPGNALFAEQILSASFPYIHVIRHPADVWYSCKRDAKFASLNEFVETYSLYQSAIFKTNCSNFKILIYEDFIENKEAIARSLFDFLGLDTPRNDYATLKDNGKELSIVRNHTGKTSNTLLRLEDPIDARSVGSRKDLPCEEKDFIEEKLFWCFGDNIMKRFGSNILK